MKGGRRRFVSDKIMHNQTSRATGATALEAEGGESPQSGLAMTPNNRLKKSYASSLAVSPPVKPRESTRALPRSYPALGVRGLLDIGIPPPPPFGLRLLRIVAMLFVRVRLCWLPRLLEGQHLLPWQTDSDDGPGPATPPAAQKSPTSIRQGALENAESRLDRRPIHHARRPEPLPQQRISG